MKRIGIADLVQVIVAISVLVGLGMVIIELRQAKALSTADLLSQQFQMGAARESSLLGDNAARSVVKSCLEPEALEPEDIAILDSIHWSIYNGLSFLGLVRNTAGLDLELKEYAADIVKNIFSTPFGRSWWELNRSHLPDELVAIGDPILQSSGPPRCLEMYKYYSDQLNTRPEASTDLNP